MPMLTHSAACAHVSDAPRWGRTMEAGDTEPHENWAKQLAVQKLMKLMLDSPEADHSDAVEGLRNEEPAERGYHCLPALQQGGHLTAKICGQQRHLGGGSGADRCAQEPLGPRW